MSILALNITPYTVSYTHRDVYKRQGRNNQGKITVRHRGGGTRTQYRLVDFKRNKDGIHADVYKRQGVDILAEKDGVTYAIQCKRYDGPVGVKAVQEAYAGRDYYDRMVGAVLTNQYFTTPAVEAAKKLKILLWDGGYLESMMEEE